MPQSLTRQKILLHAFAGRRRRGDVEWYLDMIARDSPGFVILTVSIDIIIDPIHGDIAKANTRAIWLHYMWQVSCWATHGDTWRYMEQGPRSSVV